MLTHHVMDRRFAGWVGDAMASGGSAANRSTFRWDVSGRCQRSVYRELVARPQMNAFSPIQRSSSSRYTVELQVRCRKCPECLKARQRYWRFRAIQELKATRGRTWFVTLTMSPAEHSTALYRAISRLKARGVEWHDLNAGEQFGERVASCGPLITKWMKRVRKESGAPLRYILVVEEHTGGGKNHGLPHFHMLLHEGDIEKPVGARVFRNQWPHGFTHAKLVAQDGEWHTAQYVTKYLTKSCSARVRASRGYGLEAHPTSSDIGSTARENPCKTPPDPPKENQAQPCVRTHAASLWGLIDELSCELQGSGEGNPLRLSREGALSAQRSAIARLLRPPQRSTSPL